MDIVERIKIEVRQKNWLESIRRQQESGMDVKEWCLQEKISRSTNYYRLRKVREHLCEQMTPEFANEVPCQQVAVPVSVSAPAPAFSNMGLRISGNGITVETGCCMDEKLLSVILEALKC